MRCAIAAIAFACGGSKEPARTTDAMVTPPTFAFDVAPPSDKIVGIGRMPEHACAVRASGGVDCWGRMGVGRPEPRPRRIPGVADATAITGDGVCVLRATGEVACLARDRLEFVTIAGVEGVAELGHGEAGCFVMRDGGVVCTEGDFTDPQRVPDVADAIDVAKGDMGRVCVVRKGGALWCGDDPGYRDPAPLQRIEGIAPVRKISFARGSTSNAACAILESGELRCFAIAVLDDKRLAIEERDRYRQRVTGFDAAKFVGATDVALEDEPVFATDRAFVLEAIVDGKVVRWDGETTVVPQLADAVQLASGCALRAQGSVVCWGENRGGVLGQLTTIGRHVRPPQAVVGLADVETLALGGGMGWALTRKRHLYYWGQYAEGWATRVTIPAEAGTKILALTATQRGAACLLTDRGVFCWRPGPRNFTKVTEAGADVIAIAGGGRTITALNADLSVTETAIHPKQDNESDPKPIAAAPAGSTRIVRGDYETCVVSGDGAIACLEEGEWVAIPDTAGSTALAVGYTSCALRGGVPACWSIKYGSTIVEPRDPPPITGASDIARGDDRFCFVRGGALACVEDAKTVVDVIAAGVQSVELAGTGGCAIMQDRTVRCWGSNLHGELGDGSLRFTRKPVGVALP